MAGFDLIVKFDEQESESAELLVAGTIAGRPYEFLLDTGARTTCIHTDDFTRQFASAGDRHSAGVMGDIHDDLITIPDLKFGSIVCESPTVARMSAQRSLVRNLIGMDILKEYCCTFYFDEDRVSLLPAPTKLVADLFLDDAYHPYVPVRCDGVVVPTVWDTGASLTCVDLGFIQNHPTAFKAVGQSVGFDASGNSMETPLFVVSDLRCGGHLFPDHTVVGIDLSFVNSNIDHPMTMILGYSTLSKVNWVFDFPKRKWGILTMPH